MNGSVILSRAPCSFNSKIAASFGIIFTHLFYLGTQHLFTDSPTCLWRHSSISFHSCHCDSRFPHHRSFASTYRSNSSAIIVFTWSFVRGDEKPFEKLPTQLSGDQWWATFFTRIRNCLAVKFGLPSQGSDLHPTFEMKVLGRIFQK
jgi:hypothetical protein